MESDVMKTHSLDEAINTIGQLYCAHRVMPKGPVRNVTAELEVMRAGEQPAVYIRYSTPVTVDAGYFPNLLLMMSASSGAANVVQNHQSSSWRAGQTMPLSPGKDTILDFDRAFAQTSLRVDVARLEAMCARWLGHPLDRPIQFALQPLSEAFEKAWHDTMRLVLSFGSTSQRIPNAAAASLDDFLLSLILHGHPHNFSGELASPVRASTPRLVAAAEQLLRERAEERVTMSDIASELGVSVRSLQLGFRESRKTTPSAFLRQVRLEVAHRALTEAAPSVSVMDVALESGFAHMGRFSAVYKAAFGETPHMTLRRSRR
jgi:AraC-like DNA-binding protein